jgi:hypothetical protein
MLDPFTWAQESYKAICDGDHESTFIYGLDFIDDLGNDWALVMAHSEADEAVELKMAYQSRNCIMQEYMDWYMPWNEETGEVWYTETIYPLGLSDIHNLLEEVGFLYNEARTELQEFIEKSRKYKETQGG